MLIDAHCHLDYWKGEGRDSVVKKAQDTGLVYLHTTGTSVDSSREAVKLAAQYEPVYAGVGVHPWYASPIDEDTYNILKELASQPKVISICEIGLDYTRAPETKELQRDMFRQQIRLAKEVKLPIMVHGDVPSLQDIFKILAEENAQEVGVAIHGFRSDAAFARECLAMGYYLSFGKNILKSDSGPILEAARHTPNNRLLIETDAAGDEGPDAVALVAQALAEEKGLPVEKIGNMVTANFRRLFRL